jgi:hypothetical protein
MLQENKGILINDTSKAVKRNRGVLLKQKKKRE